MAKAFMESEQVSSEFTSLFSGDGPRKLFVMLSEDCEGGGGTRPSPLALSDGSSSRGLPQGKCCYFLRCGKDSVPLEASRLDDSNLLFGEMSFNALAGVNSVLGGLLKPLCQQHPSWKDTEKVEREEFLGETDRFTKALKDGLHSLVGGLELKTSVSDAILNNGIDGDVQSFSPDMVSQYEMLLEGWHNQAMQYLKASLPGAATLTAATTTTNGGATNNKDLSNVTADVGPRRELQFWRNRMQCLSSLSGQMKRKECKAVIAALSTICRSDDQHTQRISAHLRRWKQMDVDITEAAVEAKDNIKYLVTLERFIEPLYSGTPVTILDMLLALMNSIKMIYTISRYYNTTERLTSLFTKITDQMIENCKHYILDLGEKEGSGGGDVNEGLWEVPLQELVPRLRACLKVNSSYQEHYHITKAKFVENTQGKQFECDKKVIFGHFDLFCRRLVKLIDLFTTVDQFKALGRNKLEGMDELIERFNSILQDFKRKKHALLEFHCNNFDRDYVEFNVNVANLEESLKEFINESFENITNIERSLQLLQKFQSIFQRDILKSDLDSKLNIIFQTYGMELEQVQRLYERQKTDPPIPRNQPPVAGNIMWSRHLLQHIEEPMRHFESNPNVLAGKDAKRIIKMYNRIARTLVAFEYLWFEAWVKTIDQAKAGLQATLIIRHPDDGKLYVNFDQEIMQLIREAKCLGSMGLDIPESAKIVLFQEEKFKRYYDNLNWALTKYNAIVMKVIPMTALVLRPHFNDLEYKLRPGMITLTWTSMNIEAYQNQVHADLNILDEFVSNINDIIENRIEKNLGIASKILLVNLPVDRTFNIQEFLDVQCTHIETCGKLIEDKNIEIFSAVEDLVKLIQDYPFDEHLDCGVSEEEVDKIRKQFNHFMYQALVNCAVNSIDALKSRIQALKDEDGVMDDAAGPASVQKPFFDVDVQLEPPVTANFMPSLQDIQECANKCTQAILDCFKRIKEWTGNLTFFNRVANDEATTHAVYHFNECVQDINNSVNNYVLESFGKYDWLWREDKDASFKQFTVKDPTLDDYEDQLRAFNKTEDIIDGIPGENRFGGAIFLNTGMFKAQLKQECMLWKNKYCQNLHVQTRNDLDALTEYVRVTTGKLRKEVTDLDSLRFIMNILKEVRARESGIDKEMTEILNMYQMLEYHLGSDFIDKEEIDQKTVIRAGWTRLIRLAENRADELSKAQDSLKKNMTKNIRSFSQDVVNFRKDFIAHGPMQNGLTLSDAIDRLSRFKEECKIRERKFDLYRGGEELFTLSRTEYPDLDVTVREVGLCDQLFGLYGSLMEAVGEWKEVPWNSVAANIEKMIESMENFVAKSKKLPSRVKDWEACKQLYNEVEKVSTILPIIQELSKESIMPRHWDEVMQVTGSQLEIGDPNFKLQNLLDIDIVDYKDELLEITEGADKQLKIQQGLQEITSKWGKEQFVFSEWKSRGVFVLTSTGVVMEELEEAQLNLQTMISMRHAAPFREEAQNTLQSLSDTSDVFERWLKVQIMWCSLESVFTGGDIAKQMPTEAKKNSRVDKDWAKLMQKANATSIVMECCANQALRSSLPTMYTELEKCQKSLEGYLEQKRSKFPRFYFVSNPGLLMILSQGSDPLTMNEHYEKVFDSIATVSHNSEDKHLIEAFNGQGEGAESIPFSQPVKAQGNIEDWLCDLLQSMQLSMKNLTRSCAANILSVSKDISGLRGFVDGSVAQMALLGVQMLWTADVQLALEKCQSKKNAMKECNTKQVKILQEMSSWCLQDLGTKTNRTKVESLVTIHVHQRDVINDLVTLYRQKRISDANDFEWLKQARFYWQPTAGDDVDNDGACVVSITDVDFSYQYEYLGSKERLVITPLTDRCYITLAQALGMYFGGAPAGPAGTGKTETVKDLGRTLGLYVVVTNCTDQQKYTDCAKIFKGLCQGGLWGCFDEFNRILLPVLSVVAQQVLAIQNAKKAGVGHFYFPGDSQQILLKPVCGFFITMNPGYAGRQELPENLKSLFRGVAMMVPDFQIIMKVRLCSVGYTDFELLAQKFFVLYSTCKEQLSAQKHYDWGLRNILSVLRTAGETKRENVDKPESFLLYRTLRDMNLSKLIAQDVPLFLSLLADLFPAVATPPKRVYGIVEEALKEIVEKENLVHHPDWVAKVIQLYETTLVRHGIMLVGPTGGGKTMIFRCLRKALEATTGIVHKEARFNPKSIRAPEMYGEIDPLSGEWNTGVFSAMWAKFNNRSNSYNTWIIADGPVDAIWIEDLNTVLDDNKILTLANGDRIPMTENVKAMFEVESLVNASPATVSRTGIIYVSDTDLDWEPVVKAWVCSRQAGHQSVLSELFRKWMGDCTPSSPGHLVKFLVCNTKQVMQASRIGLCMGLCDLLGALIDDCINVRVPVDKLVSIGLEKLFLFALAWSVGGLLEFEDRVKFDEWLRKHDSARAMPAVMEGETLYEYVVDVATLDWKRWAPPQWTYPDTDVLDFSNLLIPTVDSTRALYLLRTLHKMRRPVFMVGAEGTAKTSAATMFFRELDPSTDIVKCINFSSATTPFMCQNAIEQELEKRGGKTFGPPANKKMTVFIDDLSMPEINAWGDQPTLEMVRLMVEWGGFHFLDKEKGVALRSARICSTWLR